MDFLRAECPSCHPTISVKALKGTQLKHLLLGLPFALPHPFFIHHRLHDVASSTIRRLYDASTFARTAVRIKISLRISI